MLCPCDFVVPLFPVEQRQTRCGVTRDDMLLSIEMEACPAVRV